MRSVINGDRTTLRRVLSLRCAAVDRGITLKNEMGSLFPETTSGREYTPECGTDSAKMYLAVISRKYVDRRRLA